MLRVITILIASSIFYVTSENIPKKGTDTAQFKYALSACDSLALIAYQSGDVSTLEDCFADTDSISLFQDSLVLHQSDTIRIYSDSAIVVGQYRNRDRQIITWNSYEIDGELKEISLMAGNSERWKVVSDSGVIEHGYVSLSAPIYLPAWLAPKDK